MTLLLWRALQLRERVLTARISASSLAASHSFLPFLVLTMGLLTALLVERLLHSTHVAWAAHQNMANDMERHIESEARFRTIMESITDGFLTFDLEWRFVTINHAAERLMGRPRAELIGKNVWEEYTESIDTQWFVEYHRAIRDNMAVAFETFDSDGGRWSEVRAYPSSEGLSVYFRDVTDRKLAEGKILSLSTAMERATEGIAHLDADGCYTYVNEAYALIHEYFPEELLGNHWLTTIAPEDHAMMLGEIERMKAEGKITCEAKSIRKEGSRFLNELTAVGEFDAEGHFLGFYAFTRDITARKAAETALHESEHRFRSAIQSMHEGMMLQNQEGEIVLHNRRAEEILGLTEDQLRGVSSLDPRWKAIHEDGAPWPGETHPAMITLKEGVEQSQRVMGIHRPNGDLTWVSINSIPMFHEDESHPYAAVVTFSDITEQKQTLEALRENNRFIQGITDASPNVLYLYDLDARRNIYTNREVASLLGYTQKAILRMGEALLPTLMHPEDLLRVLAHFERFAGVADGVICETEYRMRHANGAWRWIRSRDTVYKRVEGKPCQIVGSAQDITEQKWFEDQIAEQMTLVNEANVQMHMQQAELTEANARLGTLATTDGLTGLKNHRAFQEKLGEEYERAVRYGTPLSLLMLDVDQFKKFNDQFGHPAGDQVLKQVAVALQATGRSSDFIARYGGEEFVMVLSGTDRQGALEYGERIRAAVADQEWEQRAITVSVGGTSLHVMTENSAALVAEADQALYQSKAAGRNCVTHFRPEAPRTLN